MSPVTDRLRRLGRVPTGLRAAGRAIGLVVAAAPAAAGAYVAVTALVGLTPVAQAWLAKLVIDALAAAAGAGGEPPALAGAAVPALLYAMTLVVAGALTPVGDSLAGWLRDHTVVEVDRRLMRAGARLVDLARVERPAFQDDVRLLDQVVWLAPHLFRVVERAIGVLLGLGGLLVLLGRLHPLLPLALATLGVPHVVAARRTNRLKYEAMVRRSRAAREMDYCVRATTEPAAAKEVRVFGLGAFFLQRFHERYAPALRETTQLRFRELRLFTAIGGLYALAVGGGFWYVAAQVGAGRLSLGDVALYLAAVAQAERRLLNFANAIGSAHLALLHLPKLFELLDGAAPAIALPQPGQGRAAPPTLRTGIELAGVSFQYPESTRPVLVDVSAVLPAGKVTAVVGANGAGKSTLVKLLTRMYDPCTPPAAAPPPGPPGTTQPPGPSDSAQPRSQILLDGLPLAAYDLASLRSHTTVAYQDFAQFRLTLYENVAVGVAGIEGGGAEPSEAARDACVQRAAGWAGVDEIAARLPLGYETPLTRLIEGGVDLSGGEWQKVALARAFVRDAALVILDEPTAALDAGAEYRLFQRFRQLVAGKTALLISHRFSTVRMAEHILVLEGGRVVEAGSHEALLARGGHYASLYELQARRYR